MRRLLSIFIGMLFFVVIIHTGFGTENISTRESWTSISAADQEMDTEIQSIVNDKHIIKFNVQSFGVKGDGVTDDTQAIQKAINEATLVSGTVIIPEGVYLIDALTSINVKDNVTIIMSPKTVLKAIPNSSKNYAIMNITNVKCARIFGGVLVGERADHTGLDGEWGMGVKMIGSSNVIIKYTKANDCWGDGFYIGGNSNQDYCENVQLISVSADNNRRQGISLISGRNIDIINAVLTNTNGTSPAAGLDIEPNRVSQILDNINITNLTSANNSAGIKVYLRNLSNSERDINIRIRNHKDYGSRHGFVVSSAGGVVNGKLLIENSEWSDSRENGLVIMNHDYRSFAISVIDPIIRNSNQSKSGDRVRGSAVAIYYSPRYNIPPLNMGNIRIVNLLVNDTRAVPVLQHGIFIEDISGNSMFKISIVDPKILVETKYEKVFIKSLINNLDLRQ